MAGNGISRQQTKKHEWTAAAKVLQVRGSKLNQSLMKMPLSPSRREKSRKTMFDAL
jgi:hypothetical protein